MKIVIFVMNLVKVILEIKMFGALHI